MLDLRRRVKKTAQAHTLTQDQLGRLEARVGHSERLYDREDAQVFTHTSQTILSKDSKFAPDAVEADSGS